MRHAIDSHITNTYKVCVLRQCTHTHRAAYVSLQETRLHFVWPDVQSFDETTKKFNLHNLADTDHE